jgi:hypothetical protein
LGAALFGSQADVGASEQRTALTCGIAMVTVGIGGVGILWIPRAGLRRALLWSTVLVEVLLFAILGNWGS